MGILVLACSAASVAWRQLRPQQQLRAARALIRDHQAAAATEILERLARATPDSDELHFLLAVSHRCSARLDLVEPYLSRATELGWSRKEIDRQRCLMRFQVGDFRSSGPELMQLLLEDATDDEAEEVYEAMARGYLAGLRFHEAAFILGAWLDWRPTSVQAHFLRGEMAELNNDQTGEIAAYRAALDHEPEHFEARRRLAHALMLSHEMDEAYQLLSDCHRDRPSDPATLLALAEWHQRRADLSQAKARLGELLEVLTDARQRATALRLLGELALSERDTAGAARYFRHAVEEDPANVGALYALSQALQRNGADEQAAPYLERWRRMRELEDELDDLRDGILTRPDDPELRYRIGAILVEKGDTQAGVNWLLSVFFHDPMHLPTHHVLSEHYDRVGQSELAARHRAIAAGKLVEAAGPSSPLVIAPTAGNMPE